MQAGRRTGRRAAALGAVVATAITAAGAWAPASAAAATTTYYVSAQGNDAWAGTKARPWASLQKAASTAPAGATVSVGGGTYAPFTVSRSGQAFTAASGARVVVQGRAGVRDVIRVAASSVKLTGMTVTGCVPDPAPRGGFEDTGSSGVRIDDGAANVTVQSMVIRDSHGTNAAGLPFGCYGILVHRADGSRLLGNDISGNGAGIYFNGGGKAAQVTGNKVHDNDVIIRNTPGGNDDFGGSAISFTNLTASPGPTATGNVLTGNAGPSSDYQTDGGGFEVYNASHLRISGNTLTGNENVLETGTGAGGQCTDNTFTGNTAKGLVAGSRLTRSVGMILRCATGMLVDRNSFTDIDWWVYDIETGDQFSTGVRGLTITGNTVSQWQKVYHLGVDPVAEKVTIDRNRLHFTGPVFASYADGTTSPSVADWQARTGLDKSSTLF